MTTAADSWVRRGPFPFLAGLLSSLMPGMGQVYAGRPRRGFALLLVVLALGAGALVLWAQGSLFVLRLLVQPDVLLALLVANFAVFAFRVFCVIDAYRLAWRHRSFGGGMGVRAFALSLLVTLTAAPHVAAGYYDFESYDLLRSVFAAQEPLDPAPDPTPEPPVATGHDPAPPGGPAAAVAAATDAAATGPATTDMAGKKPERPSYWRDRGRLNILLVGGDAGPGRWGLRTDTMIVVSIDPRTKRTAVFSIPRNLQKVPFPPSAHAGEPAFGDILNALWQYAGAHPELFPGAVEPGPTALKETIGNLLGLKIDYYAAVDLRGFVEVVDALGGVTVKVQRHIWDAGVSPAKEGEDWTAIDLDEGFHSLDGRDALAYVRTRWASSDYDRMQRQRCTIGALVQQASFPKLLRAFPKLASTVKKYAQTDVPLKALPDLLELVTALDTKRTVAVSFVPPRFGPVPDLAEFRRAVRAALRASPKLDEETGLVTLGKSCA